jgi:hypothetical protein
LVSSERLTKRKVTRMTTSNTTTTALAEHVVTEEEDVDVQRSPYENALAKIMDETGRPRHEAVAGLQFITEMVQQARTGTRCGTVGTHHLTYDEMNMLGYEVMDEVMPHGETALPDSAHAAIEMAVLGADEFRLVHDNPTGMPEDCVVTTSFSTAV